MDTILIRDLELWVHVGVPEAERAGLQRLLVSLELEHDFTAAAASDNLEGTLDYHAVCVSVAELARSRSWCLIETLAVRLAEHVLATYRPQAVTVEIQKFILPDTRHVGVRVRRAARPGRA